MSRCRFSLSNLESALKLQSKTTRSKSKSKYFKHVCQFYGLLTPEIEQVHKSVVQEAIGSRPSPDCVLEIAAECLSSTFHETKHCGILTIHRSIQVLLPDLPTAKFAFQQIESFFDEKEFISDWSTCDNLCGRAIFPLISKFPEIAQDIDHWKISCNPWKRRACAVSFVKLFKRKEFHSQILLICESALSIDIKDSFVQRGCGWLLRELSVQNIEHLIRFVKKHYNLLTRQGLRYALEKFEPEIARELMDYHKTNSSM